MLARRLANQQLAAPRSADPADVARQLGAVQSQEYAQSLWALGLRTQGASAASVRGRHRPGGDPAHLADARHHPPRPGRGCALDGAAAGWAPDQVGGRHVRRIGLTPDVLARAADVVTGALRGGQQLRRKDLYALLTSNGIDCSASPNGGRGNHILGYLSMTGLLCIGPVRARAAGVRAARRVGPGAAPAR